MFCVLNNTKRYCADLIESKSNIRIKYFVHYQFPFFFTCFWFGVLVETKGCCNRETWLNRGPAAAQRGGRAFLRH